MVDIELLKKFSLFKELDNSQLQKFAGYIRSRKYSAYQGDDYFGESDNLVCSKGDQGDEIFFIHRGSVTVELPLYRTDSAYKNVAEIGEGNFFGELSFFDSQSRSANVRANGDVELLVLSRRDYDRAIKDNIKEGCRIQSKIIAGLVGIIREMNETYSSAGFLL